MSTDITPAVRTAHEAVQEAVATAPRLSLERGWTALQQEDSWVLVVAGASAAGSGQTALVGAGIALEHAVVALEARGLRVDVDLLPPADPAAVALLRVLGTGPVRQPLRAPAHQDVRPSDLRQLNLTAEALVAEVLWSSDLATRHDLSHQQRVPVPVDPPPLATVVTPSDTPLDWVHAGRAVGHLIIRATELGLPWRLELHALGHEATRAEVRDLWRLQGWPQAQLTVGPSAQDQDQVS